MLSNLAETLHSSAKLKNRQVAKRFCFQYPFINYLGVHEAVRQQHEADGTGKEDTAAIDGPDPAHVLPVGHAEQVHVVQGPTQTHNHHWDTCSINDVRFEVLS